jgi:hypothetical protein
MSKMKQLKKIKWWFAVVCVMDKRLRHDVIFSDTAAEWVECS